MTAMIILFLFQCFLTILMIVLINSFGNVKKGYVTLDQLLSTTNLGYNLFYRILSPVVFISFYTLILFELGLPSLTTNIWLISVYYFAYNFILLLIMRKFELVNKLLYFVIVFMGIILSWWVYSTTLQYGLNAILPDAGGFKTELWLIIIGYFYSLLNNFTPNFGIENRRKNQFLLNRYKTLSQKYDIFLLPKFKTKGLLRLIFYSIMITEDINRPPLIRLGENCLFFTGLIRTTGIMQVTNSKILSDKESVTLAQHIIFKSYKKHLNTQGTDYTLASKIAEDYNAGGYGTTVMQNYGVLQNLI